MEKTIEDIEQAITQLPQAQLIKFRGWYEQFDSDVWDKQLQRDILDGTLDDIANAAIADHKTGKSKQL